MSIFIGTAGWSLRKEHAEHFSASGTHLERYAARLNCVEINSSFYRPHQTKTYRRWAESAPDGFRFAVKVPRAITHESRLVDVEEQVSQFLLETSGLGEKFGAILVQLPPSLEFERDVADRFFRFLGTRTNVSVVCEPRHRSWFEPEADALMDALAISRAAADPSLLPAAAVPGGSPHDCYFRWHGSPRMYYSSYDEAALAELAHKLIAVSSTARNTWCIFDNTAVGAATQNALTLMEMVRAAK